MMKREIEKDMEVTGASAAGLALSPKPRGTFFGRKKRQQLSKSVQGIYSNIMNGYDP